jgi:O-antigen/teichoic acid export membrane protein
MRARYRYLGRSFLDLTAAAAAQVTLLSAIFLIFARDDLRNTAFFTFSLAVCGPISLFAGMSLTELLFSNSERYRNIAEIALAQTLAFVALAVAAGIALGFWDRSYLPVYILVAICRLADLLALLSLNVMRSNGWFGRIALVSTIQLASFAFFSAAFLKANVAPVYLEVAAAMMVASIVQLNVSAFWLRETFRSCMAWPIRPVAFVKAHLSRSVAISLNSAQSNIPRYGLEFFISPQHQAAYSLLCAVARIGTITLQSAFVPVVGAFKSLHGGSPRRAILYACGLALITSVVLTGLAVGGWVFAVDYDLARRFGRNIDKIVTPATGIFVLVGSGVYLLRFGVWQLVSLLDPGRRQTRYAVWGALVTLVLMFILVPRWQISGAAGAELIGNLILIVLPIIWWLRPTKDVA